MSDTFKVGLSPSKKNCVICFFESPLKMMKNAFYFILKIPLVLKIFQVLVWISIQVEKTDWLERSVYLQKLMTWQPG